MGKTHNPVAKNLKTDRYKPVSYEDKRRKKRPMRIAYDEDDNPIDELDLD